MAGCGRHVPRRRCAAGRTRHVLEQLRIYCFSGHSSKRAPPSLGIGANAVRLDQSTSSRSWGIEGATEGLPLTWVDGWTGQCLPAKPAPRPRARALAPRRCNFCLPPVPTAFLGFVVSAHVPGLLQLRVLINTCLASSWFVPANLLRTLRTAPFKSLSTPEIVIISIL